MRSAFFLRGEGLGCDDGICRSVFTTPRRFQHCCLLTNGRGRVSERSAFGFCVSVAAIVPLGATEGWFEFCLGFFGLLKGSGASFEGW